MDNQHEKIAGYRDLPQADIDLMNEIKAQEENLKMAVAAIGQMVKDDPDAGRWVSLARTHLETGLMFLIKAVARPDNGLGRR